jgi:hypothetical protein
MAVRILRHAPVATEYPRDKIIVKLDYHEHLYADFIGTLQSKNCAMSQ